MVVANALAALSEIREMSTQDVVKYTPQLLFKLLRALNECTEWGQVSLPLGVQACPSPALPLEACHRSSYFIPDAQVFILDALSSYRTDNPKDAEAIIERVTPRLQHANAAVVLSAVKVRRRLQPAL